MDKAKALSMLRQIKRMVDLFGDGIPQEELDLLGGLISKLERNEPFEDLNEQEFSYLQRNYAAVYGG